MLGGERNDGRGGCSEVGGKAWIETKLLEGGWSQVGKWVELSWKAGRVKSRGGWRAN